MNFSIFCSAQSSSYSLSQTDINFIYNEVINIALVRNNSNLDICCIKELLKKYDTLHVAIDDSLFNTEIRFLENDVKFPKDLKPNISNFDSLYHKITFNVQKPFKVVRRKMDNSIGAPDDIIIHLRFGNIIKFQNTLYLTVLYYYNNDTDESKYYINNIMSFEIKICEDKLLYFNKILLGWDSCRDIYHTVDLNSSFCK